MAITILKEPKDITEGYNDAYLIFSGTTVINEVPDYAEIMVDAFNRPFKLYPDTNGVFQFNLKELVKVYFNDSESGFEDDSTPPATSFHQLRTDKYLQLVVSISVIGESSNDNLSRTYEFFKSVRQVGEPINNNLLQILHNTEDGTDYNITYFEGYPFYFELQKVENDSIKIVNLGTTDEVTLSAITEVGTLEVWVDRSNENWNSENYLPLINGNNRLEIYQNNVFRNNLNIKMKTNQCGVYLKWLNNKGGYSFFLFEEFFRTTVTGRSLGAITRNSFLNRDENPKSSSFSAGVSVRNRMTLQALVDKNELKMIQELAYSPSIQMYTSTTPYVNGEFITVTINGSINNRTKSYWEEVKLTIDLPEQNTMTY